ncbi:MAG: Limonene hydroxylase [Pelotomaculum sp. PtaB.Bin104]|nr:MAG: Limonene hydroxylase [Pelotomaculum sp. PtaB.Bin104]
MQSLKDIHTYKVIEAWRLFSEQNVVLEGVLRPEIERSWKRSKAMGLNPWTAPLPPISFEAIDWLLNENRDLLKLAQPIMHYIYATSSKFYLDNIVCLISKSGIIINKIKNNDPYLSVIGRRTDEEHVGTTPGSVILKEEKPYAVGGYENYMNYFQTLFGGGSPIFNSSGEIMGVLGLFNPFGKIPEQPLDMIITAASIIEDSLRSEDSSRCHTDENSPAFTSLLNQPYHNALLINSEGYVVNANDRCAEIFDIPFRNIVGKHFKELKIDLNHLLTTEPTPENFEIRLNGYPIPCVLDNCSKVKGFNKIEHYLLLFSEDLDKRVLKKTINVPVDINTLTFNDIIGVSDSFGNVLRLAYKAAEVTAPVLIEGESGTGKDLLAHAIHNASKRTGQFIAINCGAIQPSLLQSELFGYEEGSFTGAIKGGKPGKFELAEGGTLFLDELGEMPLNMQVNFLRVLQDNTITRVGGSKSIKYDVRIIAATNVSLREAISNRTFRKDLYYRLNVINIKIPPLRERIEDIAPLSTYLVNSISQRMGIDRVIITPEVLSIFQRYHWPGNIRELSNVIENALIFTNNNKITPALLPDSIIDEIDKKIVENKMDRSEKEVIIQTLTLHNGNITKAAKDLGITRNTLYRKIDRFHIKTEDFNNRFR